MSRPYAPAALILLVPGGWAAAQEAKESGWLPILAGHAAEYEIRPRGGPEGSAIRMLPQPLLRWTQPVRGGDDGAVFLWVADGRPVLVGTVFTYRSPNSPRVMQHELHALTRTGIDVSWRGSPMLSTARPGLEFRPVPEGPAPAESAPARMRQMQAIARDFSAASVHPVHGRNELRLMPRALHRYEPAGGDPIDGALFCFAHGTDPELFLVLEARRDGGSARWEYALARFSDLELHARYKDRAVFEAPAGLAGADRVHTYSVMERADADTPEEYRAATEMP